MKQIIMIALIALIALISTTTSIASEQVGKIPSHGSGSALLSAIITDLPTDAAATVSVVVRTRGYAGLRGTVKCDKAGTLTIYPIHNIDDLTALGEASDVLTVAAGTQTDYGYSQIGAYAAKVVFEKTEAGDATSFEMVAVGTLQN